jgi:hypothetical protein
MVPVATQPDDSFILVDGRHHAARTWAKPAERDSLFDACLICGGPILRLASGQGSLPLL